MSNIVNIEVIDSQNVPSTTSLKISEVFGKRHDDVIKAIENHVAEGDLTARNFAASSYKDSSGKSNKFYILDETFTTFLVMGFTGKEAVKWKLQYIKEFQRMREEIQNSKVIRETGDNTHLQTNFKRWFLTLRERR